MHEPRVFVAVRKLSLEAGMDMEKEVGEGVVVVVPSREATRESNWPAWV